MKKSICTFFTAMAFCCTFGQYWQQQVDYKIHVSLNDKDHVLDGFEKITYTNNSPDTLTFIWFHLWPNAFKNDKTAFTQQQLLNGDTKFYFSSKEQKGYINRLSFKVNGQTARTEDHPEHIDIIKLVLPSALLPGKQVVITTPFHVKLPYNFSRGGHRGLSYQVTQWYPKPAVYDADGWHPMPYLDQGEFYSEFGSFDVKITLPESYVVAATGELQNEDEKTWLLTRGSAASDVGSKKKQTATSTARTPPSKTVKKSVKKPAAPMSKEETITAEAKTLHYMQNNVHDFAWFADKNFIVNHDTCSLPSGRVIEVYTYFNPEHKKIWKNSTQLSKDAIQFYSSEVGEYPYNIVSAVQGPQNFGGGMEYPTITVIAPVEDEKSLDIVLAHEIGHNWFYGILASNERKHPWLDEGVNSFYENKYKKAKYGSTSNAEDLLLQTKAVQHQDQPIETPSESFSLTNYILVAYHKTAKWLQLMEQETGEQQFRKAMQNYYNTWKFKHPQPQDFRNALAPALGEKAQSYFSHLNSKGSSPAEEKRTWSFVSPFSLKKYVDAPTKNLLLLSPLIGLNSYDKFMAGALITNYTLPPAKLQFFAAPLYGTGSKQVNGMGRLSYSLHSAGLIRRTEFFLNTSTFSMNEYIDSFGKKHIARFQKLVPGVRLTFKEHDARSTVRKHLTWKTFLIREGNFRFGTDTTIINTDTSYAEAISIRSSERFVNQLQFTYENHRVLYPFDVRFTIEQMKDLIRPVATANYFFNYRKEGGLNVRVFAGKIFYTNGRSQSKSFRNDRYHLNMTGPDGYEDYTYSNYFIGRNKFEGLPSQQIMMRDGGFKFRTNLLGNEVGKTDRWLTALNFNSTVPAHLNPLSVLPVKIPLRLFADIGTYADAWDRESEKDRFLFDAGLQFSLLHDVVNIYVPLIYSKVYREYFKSYLSEKRLLKTISFSINLNPPALRKLAKEIDF